jgi:hypothetical protein
MAGAAQAEPLDFVPWHGRRRHWLVFRGQFRRSCQNRALIPLPRRFQELEHVVDAKRLDRRFVCAGQQESRFAFGEPPNLPVAADRAVCDGNLATVATDATKLSHQSKTSP